MLQNYPDRATGVLVQFNEIIKYIPNKLSFTLFGNIDFTF